jgi:hypothetical protein
MGPKSEVRIPRIGGILDARMSNSLPRHPTPAGLGTPYGYVGFNSNPNSDGRLPLSFALLTFLVNITCCRPGEPGSTVWAARLRRLAGFLSLVAKKVAQCGELTAFAAVLPKLWHGSVGKVGAVLVRSSPKLYSWGVVAVSHEGITTAATRESRPQSPRSPSSITYSMKKHWTSWLQLHSLNKLWAASLSRLRICEGPPHKTRKPQTCAASLSIICARRYNDCEVARF